MRKAGGCILRDRALKGLNAALVDLREEIAFALGRFGDFASMHEGYAVILEELEELWQEIKVKQESRDYEKLRKEALQVSAMALKLVLTIEHKEESGGLE
jgi:hypothetical protein